MVIERAPTMPGCASALHGPEGSSQTPTRHAPSSRVCSAQWQPRCGKAHYHIQRQTQHCAVRLNDRETQDTINGATDMHEFKDLKHRTRGMHLSVCMRNLSGENARICMCVCVYTCVCVCVCVCVCCCLDKCAYQRNIKRSPIRAQHVAIADRSPHKALIVDVNELVAVAPCTQPIQSSHIPQAVITQRIPEE